MMFVPFALLLVGTAAKPNVLFILTDDQDTRLGRSSDYTSMGSLEIMPQTQKLLVDEGALLTNAFVNTPICCPSRTEFLTGRMYHNLGAPHGACMHVDTSFVERADAGLFGLLSAAGYDVGIFGKVTNDQPDILRRIAAARSAAYVDSPSQYNNYDGLKYFRYEAGSEPYEELLNETAPVFGTVYQTSQIGNRTLRWLDGRTRGPFFAYVGPHAPHFPATPAPWYAHAFDDVGIPETPNYNCSHEDKAQHVRQNPPIDDRVKCWQSQHFRDRWASLLSVDDLVFSLYHKLEAMGVLDDTYIVYTSDHGYKFGQWRQTTSKTHPYETDVRVPFIVRGPGIAPGSTLPDLVGNVDLLPTVLDLAGLAIPKDVDGSSFAPRLLGGDGPAGRGAFIVEYMSVGTYYFDHTSIWSSDARCGPIPRGPDGANTTECIESEGVGDGNCYIVDSTHSNSWRMLRILTEDEDLAYVEYDNSWTWNATELQFYEYYDLRADPYQQRNAYGAATPARRAALHGALADLFACRGAGCAAASVWPRWAELTT